ncbi:RluA family pseudouridine synthase [Prauserella halophila]|uniref:RluA family pseudouridine synthase n=1 Tax=Prauserella halophila TaxID=185641 RepID=UPI0020A2C758|nr:RluA family pseudouridine synthase [Prauserella halophila]MCP2235201.1 tRNA pseudouridine32 synthase / 23S rRNA pseudouridine746 synthase [Prauserella halophila]
MKRPVSPLPQRNGLDAARIRLPVDGTWATVREHLVQRLHRLEPTYIDEMLTAGRFVTATGPVSVDTPYVPGEFVWFHRDLPDEVPVPFDIGIVHRDDDLVVADKPHFLATIPRGNHVMQTALVRLRDELGLPELSPVHRLDRVTAGLLMFTVRRELRGPYQNLFRDRVVHKEYEAIAPQNPELTLPRTVRSRIVKRREVVTAEEVPGEPNAETYVELLEARDGLGRYRLVPATGRTHQLRVHLNSLGTPIVGDSFYPVTYETALDDFRNPLQLLAKVLEFTDPLTGEHRRFESSRTLSAWPA